MSAGEPVVFSHGWSLGAGDWDDQLLFLASQGYRTTCAGYLWQPIVSRGL